MASFGQTTAAIAISLALLSGSSLAQQASVSLTHTVVVSVPPRVKVQVAPTFIQAQPSEYGRTGLAVRVNATRAWAIVVGSKKKAGPPAQWVASKGERSSSMVLYRSTASQRTPETGVASDSEPVMLTVVAP